ncbi:MAG: TetR family transcriptional regulator [Actinomycetia bacterium]|nr:TetR family transcriptional regulator [Actinomycetes bacterium]
MSEKQLDPRVVRTRALLTEALYELIQERRWDKIRVQDILDRTGISRSAFYAHFDNKYDLLVGTIPELQVLIGTPGQEEPDLVPLFEHVDEMAVILKPLFSQPILSEITDSIHRHLVTAWRDYLSDQIGPDDWVVAEYLAGALGSVLASYVKDHRGDGPEPVAASFLACVQPLLASLGAGGA